MPNPYLPNWEYIPDGEPRVFGDRVYIYGSHDRVNSEDFCDFKLKVWSASVNDLDHWICHGDCFHTRADKDHEKDASWAERELYAPDVVEKDGKYYLYAYIVNTTGCVAVSEHPEGPFSLIGMYDSTAQYEDLKAHPEKYLDTPEEADIFLIDGSPEENGTQYEIACRDMQNPVMIDPGVLVDDDGRVYVYCGFLHSYMFEVDPSDMCTVIPGSYKKDIIPKCAPFEFFEACSPRKIGNTYYMIYSPRCGSRLAYATAEKPTGPFTYRGYIVDNGSDYPGGNNHGSVCYIKGQWYIFYHRMTNDTIMSRRGCVEKTELKEDGSFSYVPMTSLGFSKNLNPYEETKAELACVLKGRCFIAEKNVFSRPVVNVCSGDVIGYRYFDFGDDYSATSLKLYLEIEGAGQTGIVHVHLDKEDGQEIGCSRISENDGILSITVNSITGVHALFFTFEHGRVSWIKGNFENRELCRIKNFVFCK